jgi:hypothetical protein
MNNSIRILIIAGVVVAAGWLIRTHASGDPPASGNQPAPASTPASKGSTATPASQTEPVSKDTPAIVLTEAETQTVKDFEARVTEYVALHHKLEGNIPPLPEKNATPEQIEQHKKAFCALVQTTRKGAKQGEFFTAGMVDLVRRALKATLDGASGPAIKQSIKDDGTPPSAGVNVNDCYPDGAPVSSMPMELLTTLPNLDETLEYRFVGKRLALVDSPAQLVLDLTPNVLP